MSKSNYGVPTQSGGACVLCLDSLNKEPDMQSARQWFTQLVTCASLAGVLGGGCSIDVPIFTGADPLPPPEPPNTAVLSITRSGTATGTISANPGGIDCGVICKAAYPVGGMVMLTAMPDVGAAFAGWSGGGCTGTAPTCMVTTDAAQTVTAEFNIAQHPLTIVIGGSGAGTVTSTTGGITCPGTCTAMFPHGSQLTLMATTGASSQFLGWTIVPGGASCSGTGICAPTINGPTTITATFALNRSLEVTKSGNGSGTVTSTPAGINCGADCSETYSAGTAVSLAAVAAGDSIFTGWSGGLCSGTGGCSVSLNSATMVTADFKLKQYNLTVNKVGIGVGTVTSLTTGIDCGTTCTALFDAGSMVTLVASPAAGSLFAGWSGGGCTGTSPCTVSMAAATSVTATFAPIAFTLTVLRSGAGVGSIASSPPGVDCGTDCTEDYAQGVPVTLTANPSAGSTFTGWSGGCSGTGTCTVPMTTAITVTATFAPLLRLTVLRAGSGAGAVASSANGINCGTDCVEDYAQGTVVMLTATPSVNSTFTGWSGGGCSGTGTCVITMTTITAVTALFTANTLTITRVGAGTGTVTSSPSGISCGSDCAEDYVQGATVTLTAAASAGSVFTGWDGGNCSGIGTCTVTMTTAVNVVASFALPVSLDLLAGTIGGEGNLDGVGAAARFNEPSGVTIDGAGNLYVADLSNHTIRKVTTAGVVTTLAGTAGVRGNTDGTSAAAHFNYPAGVKVDSTGNIYVADSNNNSVRKISTTGVVTTVAGGFNEPRGVAVDSGGNVYVADSKNHVIRKVTSGGAVSTLAGTVGLAGSADGAGATARFNSPYGVAVDNAGNVLVADSKNHTIRRITPAGVVTTLAGTAGASGSTDGTGTAARFSEPSGVALDSLGNVYVADSGNKSIRKISVSAVVSTFAGGTAGLRYPFGVTVDGSGNVYVADWMSHAILKLTAAGAVSVVAGAPEVTGYVDATGAAARFYNPRGIAVDAVGNVFVADKENGVRKVSSTGVVTTLLGIGYSRLHGVALDSSGNVYVSKKLDSQISKITPSGVVTALSSSTFCGSADGTGTAAEFCRPHGLVADSAGNVYVSDSWNSTVRKIATNGAVTTLAGFPQQSGTSDGAGTDARFSRPRGIAIDRFGTLYVADAKIRRISVNGIVTTLGGSPSRDLAVDSSGNVYFAENSMIRKISPSGVVTTIAGVAGATGVLLGAAPRFSRPQGIAVLGGDLIIADANAVLVLHGAVQ